MEDKDFSEAMKRMVSEHGKEVLLGGKVKAYISDYKGSFKTEAETFLKMLAEDCAKYINEADDVPERKRQLVERMEEKHGISPRHSMPLLDLLGFLLKGDTSVMEEQTSLSTSHSSLLIDNCSSLIAPPLPNEEEQAAIEAKRRAAHKARTEADNKYRKRCYAAQGLYKNGKHKKAWPEIEALAKEGYHEAQRMLGDFYNFGEGVPQDYTKAFEWYRKAADQEYEMTQEIVGDFYEQGKGVPKDLAKAAEWWRKAAANGNYMAQKKLDELKSERKI